VDTGSENPRGIHAIRVLENKKDFTLDSLIATAYDSTSCPHSNRPCRRS
jgi:acyl-homoserine-lactone acylase